MSVVIKHWRKLVVVGGGVESRDGSVHIISSYNGTNNRLDQHRF